MSDRPTPDERAVGESARADAAFEDRGRADLAPGPPAGAAPRRRGTVIALVLSLLAMVGLAVPLALLAASRPTWQAQNEDLRARVETLTDDVSARNARIAELEQTEAQLATLKEEYSAAVNQGARGAQSVEELEDIVAGFQRCVEVQREHFDVLRESERYVASSIAEAEASLVAYCDEVSTAYAAFEDAGG